jgi:type II secretion system protein H
MKRRHLNAGFTLLEMMLTVGLIALTATFVGLNVGRSDARLADLEARRFIALLNMAQDESIVTGRPIILTVDAATHSYQFAPLDVPAVFLANENDEQERQDQGAADVASSTQVDSFFKQRFIPDVVAIQFSRLPDILDVNVDDGFVPKEIHELLNKSIFDSEDRKYEDEDAKDIILIEPNGLVSPFSLSLSIEGRVSSIGLDRFGRAALLEAE